MNSVRRKIIYGNIENKNNHRIAFSHEMFILNAQTNHNAYRRDQFKHQLLNHFRMIIQLYFNLCGNMFKEISVPREIQVHAMHSIHA